MIIGNIGRVVEDLYMVGHPAMPVYLLDGPKPAIFDAGLAFLGRLYVAGIRAIIGRRNLHYCFLSHSHFDHCGSVAALKKKFPTLKVAASKNVKRVLNRPNALTVMGQLSRAAEQLADSLGIEAAEFDPFESFEVDITLKEGDCLELSPNLSVQVHETPGHTRDSLSYFIPQKKILLCSEAAGIPDATGYVVSEALVDFEQYYDSMQRLSKMEFEILCLGHRLALSGRDAENYFQKSMADCRHFLNLVEGALEEYDGNLQKVVALVKAVEYDPVPEPKQIEPAYLLNLEAKVKVIKKRWQKGSGNIQAAN